MLMNGTVITALTLDRGMGDEKENSRVWWQRRKKWTSQCDNPLCPHLKFPLKFPHSPDSYVSYERWKMVVAGLWVHVGKYMEIKRHGWLQVPWELGRGQSAEAWGRGQWQPTESLMKAPGPQDIRSRVCGMFTTQGRSWMKLRMKVPPRTVGEYSPHHCQCAQSRMLTQPTGAKKKKKVMQTAMR